MPELNTTDAAPRPRRLRLAAALFAVAAALLAAAVLTSPSGSAVPASDAAPNLAPLPTEPGGVDAWLERCATSDATGPVAPSASSCLSAALVEVEATRGTAVALDEVARLLRDVPALGSACHEPVHVLGRRAFERHGDVPGALTGSTSTCELGFYHGVFEAWGLHATPREVSADAPGLCGLVVRADPDFYPAKCAHAVGHAAWPAAAGDLTRALEICESLGEVEQVECGAGVTMSMVDGLGGTEPLELDTPADVVSLCASYPEHLAAACYADAGSFMLRVSDGSIPAALDACGLLPAHGEARAWCVGAVGYHSAHLAQDDVTTIVQDCDLDDERLERSCLEGAVKKVRLLGGPAGSTAATLSELCGAVPASFAAACRDLAAAENEF